MSVAPTFASALKSSMLQVTSSPPTAAAWGNRAVSSSVTSPFEAQIDAQAEADRQATFMSGPRAIDEHIIPGLMRGVVGTVVTITADRLGYENGAAVFVLGADETAAEGTTTLTVIKRLAA